MLYGTSWSDPDTDGDGYLDGTEVLVSETDPLDPALFRSKSSRRTENPTLSCSRKAQAEWPSSEPSIEKGVTEATGLRYNTLRVAAGGQVDPGRAGHSPLAGQARDGADRTSGMRSRLTLL